MTATPAVAQSTAFGTVFSGFSTRSAFAHALSRPRNPQSVIESAALIPSK